MTKRKFLDSTNDIMPPSSSTLTLLDIMDINPLLELICSFLCSHHLLRVCPTTSSISVGYSEAQSQTNQDEDSDADSDLNSDAKKADPFICFCLNEDYSISKTLKKRLMLGLYDSRPEWRHHESSISCSVGWLLTVFERYSTSTLIVSGSNIPAALFSQPPLSCLKFTQLIMEEPELGPDTSDIEDDMSFLNDDFLNHVLIKHNFLKMLSIYNHPVLVEDDEYEERYANEDVDLSTAVRRKATEYRRMSLSRSLVRGQELLELAIDGAYQVLL